MSGIMRVLPDTQTCPCCGEFMYYTSTKKADGIPAINEQNTEAICVQAHDSAGVLAYHRLNWRCKTCGCQWPHGQFNQSK